MASKELRAKRRCCKDKPRCKRCPVALKRLEKAGLAERDGRRYVVSARARRADLKAARAA